MLNWLLIFVPVTVALEFLMPSAHTMIFIASCLAIVPLAGWLGVSLYGSAKYLAQKSGGEAIKAGKPKDYSAGLARIIGNLTARYSLGFALAENEVDDGRLHNLEVRVNAKDEKGKSRKLLVSSRQGYYMSTAMPKEAAARAQ